MGVVLKRAQYFITCKGKTLYPIRLEENYLTRQLTAEQEGYTRRIGRSSHENWRQLSLFDDMGLK